MSTQNNNGTFNPVDPPGSRQVSPAEAQRIIRELINTSRYGQAASVAMQIANQLPKKLWPHYLAATALLMNQQVEPAFHYINRALEIDSCHLDSLVIKARLFLESGEREQAIRQIDAAIDLSPGNSALHYEKAEILTDLGKLEAARKGFLKSIELDIRNSSSLLGLSRLPGDNFSDELIKKLESIVQSKQLRGKTLIETHFALALACEKKGDIERQFAHLTEGNELKKRTVNYDPDIPALETQKAIEYFSADFFTQHTHRSGNPARIIFIVGFPRCGSTLVEQILCTHPDVSGAGEVFALDQATFGYQQSRNLSAVYPYWVGEQSSEALTAIADDYLRRVEKFNKTDYLTDKLLANYKSVGLIHLIFPNARIVNVQRNPVDVCYSCYKRLFKLDSLPYMYDLEHLASRYLDYQRMIAHWNEVLPGKIHTLKYEQLIENQKDVTRNLLEYCGLSWEKACLEFHKNSRTVHTHSNVQVRQKLYSDSVDRWKPYKEYLGPLMKLKNA